MTVRDARPQAQVSLRAPLAHRDFALLWGGFIVSHVGDSVQIHAQAWLVTELTHSGLKLGGVALAQALPRLLLGLFAGVIVDRVDRRRLLIATQALAMAQSLAFLALVLTGRITYAQVLVLAALLGVFDTLNLTARIAMMPTLVPRELLGKAIALQALGVNVVQIAGPTTAALLIGALGVAGCLATNAATFLVLLAALLLMRPTPRRGRPAGDSFGDELREGFAFVRARPAIWGSILLAYAIGLFGMPSVRLLALFARVVLGTDGRGYGFLAAASGLGAIAASILVTARARPEHLPRNIAGAAAVFAVATIGLGLSGSYAAAFGAMALLGFGQMASRSATTTLIQLATPDRLRGRVLSFLMLDFSLWSVGALLGGAAADRVAALHAAHAGAAPRAAMAFGLHAVIASAGLLCLLSTAALSLVVLRRRLPAEPDPGDDRARGPG